MPSNAKNASLIIQSSCQAVLQNIRWAEEKGITQQEQENRHLGTKVFIQGQLEIIRGTVTEGVVVPRWMVALESAFRTLGNSSHPDYQALSQGLIPIPSDHPWLKYTVPPPPVAHTQSMPPAPAAPTPLQNPATRPLAPPHRPVPVASNRPPPTTQSAAPILPPILTPTLPQPSRPTPLPITEVSASGTKQGGTRPTPKVRGKGSGEPKADSSSEKLTEANRKETVDTVGENTRAEKRKGKAKDTSESTMSAEKRQERQKKRQADPEPMEVDDDECADDDDEIQVIEPEKPRGRTKSRRGKSKRRPSPTDPDIEQIPMSTSPATNKADCVNCVKYNRKCDKQDGMACKPCQQNKQKCEHSAKNKRRGVGSGSGAVETSVPSSSHRRTSVKRPSSASESRDSDDNEGSSNQDGSTCQRKKTKVGEESDNPLDDPRQTIIVPGPRGMTFAGVVPPAVPPNYPRVIVPAPRPPTARPTRNASGARTGPAAIRADLHVNCVSREDFDAMVERIRALEQAVDTLGRAVGSGWPQVRTSPFSVRPTALKYPFELQQVGISGTAPNRTSSAPESPSSPTHPDETLVPRPSTPQNPDGTMLVSSPTPRATSAHEGISRHVTPMEAPGSPTIRRPLIESSESNDSSKGGPSADPVEDVMEGMEASG